MTNKTKKSKWLKLALISTASLSTLASIPAVICAKSTNSKTENKAAVKTSTPVLDTSLEATEYVKVTFKLKPEDTTGPYPATLTGKTVNKVKKGRDFVAVNKPTALKTGFKFKGWASTAGSTTPIPNNTPVDTNMTVYAIFDKTSSIVVRVKKDSSTTISNSASAEFTAVTTPGIEVDWYVWNETTKPSATTQPRATIEELSDGSAKVTANNESRTGSAYVFALPKGSTVPGTIDPATQLNVLKIEIVDPTLDPKYENMVIITIGEGASKVEYAIDPHEFCSVESADEPLSGINIATGATESTGITKAAFNAPIRFGKSVTTIPNNFLDAGKTDSDFGFKAFNNTITFNDAITHIGSNFLSDNTEFDNPLTLPASLLSIDDHFLSGCTSFNSEITFGHSPSIYNIGDNFMDGCTDYAENFVVPASVTQIGTHFMYNCNSVTDVTINCSVFAFAESDGSFAIIDTDYAGLSHNVAIHCDDESTYTDMKELFPNLTPDKETGKNMVRCLTPVLDWTTNQAYLEDEDGVFHPVTSLVTSHLCGTTEAITVDGKTWPRSEFNLKVHLNPELPAIPDSFLYGCTSFNQPIDIPEGTISIGDSFLEGCTNFNSGINISSGVTTIGHNFLYGCTNFDKPINLPSVVTIGNNFAANCKNLNSKITFSENLGEIGNNFLDSCLVFNQPLTIPANVSSIGTAFVHDCFQMTSAIKITCAITAFADSNDSFATTNPSAPCLNDGIEIDVSTAEIWAAFQTKFPDNPVGGTAPWRKTVRAIPWVDQEACIKVDGEYRFFSSLTGSNICTDSGQAIKDDGNRTYERITFNYQLILNPNKVTAIPNNFLNGCNAYDTEFTLPNSITTIGDHFMEGCTSFKQHLTIPDSITGNDVIGEYFMYNCTSFYHTDDLLALLLINCSATCFKASDYTCATENQQPMGHEIFPIRGADAENFKSKFGTRQSPYRWVEIY